jgi:hypothetical protein
VIHPAGEDVDRNKSTYYQVISIRMERLTAVSRIILSADERLFEAARKKAQEEHTTLNAEFRLWLEAYVSRQKRSQAYRHLMQELQDVSSGGRVFTRD